MTVTSDVIRPRAGVLLVLALVASLLAVLAPPADAGVGAGDLSIIKDDEAPSNAEIATRLSEETPLPNVQRVVIARDDEFADALASGVMQGDSPLLLVPSGGPVSDRTLAEITRLGASSAVILGGTAAVGDAVVEQLRGRGLDVARRSGGSRIETAVDIARNEAGGARTALVARAFASDPNNPTQAFADALAAGGVAAENGWPILLTQTDALSPATREYILSSEIDNVRIVGGTAAVSEAVANELAGMVAGTVERIAGETRGGTAAELAKEVGADSAADVARVVLVDGTSPDGWAGGFAAAAHAAFYDAPILLADGVRLLPETTAFLEPGTAFAQAGDLTVTCVVHPLACTEGRRALGLIDYPLLGVTPPRGVLVQPGQTVTLSLTPVAEGAGVPIAVSGSCIDINEVLTADAQGRVTVQISQDFEPEQLGCLINVSYEGDGSVLTSTLGYTLAGEPPRQPGEAAVASDVLIFGGVPSTPAFVNSSATCTGPSGATGSADGWAMQALFQQPGAARYDFANVSSELLRTEPGSSCTVSIVPPEGTLRVFWGLYTFSDSGLRVPLALGSGTSASFDLSEVGTEFMGGAAADDVSVRWVLQIAEDRPAAPQPPPPGLPSVLNNPDGLPIVCGPDSYGQGVFVLDAGTPCTASTGGVPGFNVFLAQPDRDIVSAPQVSFTTLEDTRFTTLRAQALIPAGSTGTSCEDAIPLSLNQATGGELIGESIFYSVALEAGREVRMRMSAAFGNPELGTIDPLLILRGSDGVEQFRNDDAEGSLNSRIDGSTDATDTFCLEASSFGGTTGTFVISVDDAPFYLDADTLSPEVPGFNYAFDYPPGVRVVAEMRAPGGAGTDPVLQVLDPAGNVLAFDDDGGGFPNARVEFVTPTEGTYTYQTTVFGDSYGDYTLEISATDATAAAFASRTADDGRWVRTGAGSGR